MKYKQLFFAFILFTTQNIFCSEITIIDEASGDPKINTIYLQDDGTCLEVSFKLKKTNVAVSMHLFHNFASCDQGGFKNAPFEFYWKDYSSSPEGYVKTINYKITVTAEFMEKLEETYKEFIQQSNSYCAIL